MRPVYRALVALVALAATSGLVYGQAADTALIVGTVTDATGAVIPGSSITFAHLSTGIEYAAETGETGTYRSPPLRIGEYIILAEADGFKQ